MPVWPLTTPIRCSLEAIARQASNSKQVIASPAAADAQKVAITRPAFALLKVVGHHQAGHHQRKRAIAWPDAASTQEVDYGQAGDRHLRGVRPSLGRPPPAGAGDCRASRRRPPGGGLSGGPSSSRSEVDHRQVYRSWWAPPLPHLWALRFPWYRTR